MLNYETCMPAGEGDLFCAGHAWLPNGTLLVAGGTEEHGGFVSPVPPPPPGNGWTGSRLAYVFDPNAATPALMWTAIDRLDARRWYPSVVVLGKDPNSLRSSTVVLGGTDNGAGVNSYQAQDPATPNSWVPRLGAPPNEPNTFPGPSAGPPPNPERWQLHDYPRHFLLSNGLAALAGMRPGTTRMDHYHLTGPTYWQANDPNWAMASWRDYGTAVLCPLSFPSQQFDQLWAIGGFSGAAILSSVERSVQATANNGSQHWVPSPTTNMSGPRWFLNSVLLPDSTVLVVGGEQVSTTYGCATSPALHAEAFRGGLWKRWNATDIIRDYHSSALLLPSAKVMTASGESRRYLPGPCPRPQNAQRRTDEVDYQVFSPPYLHCGYSRPVIRNAAAQGSALAWTLNSTRYVEYDALPPGTSVSAVVLARAGSVTHHCDPNQRVANLAFTHVPPVEGGRPGLNVSVPANSNSLPQGHYMLFLVTNLGTPSTAAWVSLQ